MASATAEKLEKTERRRERLLTALAGGGVEARREAALKLVHYAPPLEALTASLLHDENVYVRRNAARTLGRLRDANALPALIAALNDPKISVRNDSIRALTKIGGEQALIAIISKAGDRRLEVRTNVTDTLGRWSPPPVGLVLSALANTPTPKGQSVLREVLRQWEYVRGQDAARLLLIAPQATPALKWSLLQWLSEMRPRGVFTSRKLVDPLRYCRAQSILTGGSEAAARAGAQAILDYLSLGRASRQETPTGELLRATGQQSLSPAEMLRPADLKEKSPRRAGASPSLFVRVRGWFAGSNRRQSS